jgi:hypothetical protein
MHPELSKLLDLQAKDEQLERLNARAGELSADVAALDGALKGVRATFDSAERAVRDAQRRREELGGRLDHYRRIQDQRSARLEGVASPREASALMAELDLARSVLAKEEGEVGRYDADIVATESRMAAARVELDVFVATQAPARAAVATRNADLAQEREAARAAREESAARLDRALRSRYDRLRRLRASNVVVAMQNAVCGACHTAIPTSARSQFRGGLLLDGCEACGVILYSAEAVG